MRIEATIDISRRWLWLVGGTLLAVALLGTVTLAGAHGGSADMIHACYKDNEGQLAWAAPFDTCATNETAIHWPKRSLADREIVSFVSPTTSSGKTVGVPCPSGKLAVGGGYNIDGSTAVNVVESYPTLGTSSAWIVRASEIGGGTTTAWSITVYAICVRPIG